MGIASGASMQRAQSGRVTEQAGLPHLLRRPELAGHPRSKRPLRSPRQVKQYAVDPSRCRIARNRRPRNRARRRRIPRQSAQFKTTRTRLWFAALEPGLHTRVLSIGGTVTTGVVRAAQVNGGVSAATLSTQLALPVREPPRAAVRRPRSRLLGKRRFIFKSRSRAMPAREICQKKGNYP